ncbi:MAG: hypothetical protein EOP48_31570 [Sphingobacteriales bacterium]|nr:MAG: hypothetical protein EOP48_31570 [Sphingobacteriales bacterium]
MKRYKTLAFKYFIYNNLNHIYMSGSSDYSFDQSAKPKNCEDIVLRTQLASPDPDVVADLSIGYILRIHLFSAVGPLQALTADNRVAGAILTSNPGLLINCINGGTEFQAKVLSINGGDCQISIYCSNK